MNAPTDTSPAQNDDQRDALEQSERAATERQPENFKDSSTKEKKVEVGPDMTDDPIKSIDPDERPGSTR